jgi:hypothetical protein
MNKDHADKLQQVLKINEDSLTLHHLEPMYGEILLLTRVVQEILHDLTEEDH